ncbi:MAG: hypothetical protein ABI554_11275, partial [Flavobacterium sp.]
FFLAVFPSPDRNGNPCGLKCIFFLHQKSDQRKLLLGRRKNHFKSQDCNGVLEIASKKNDIL